MNRRIIIFAVLCVILLLCSGCGRTNNTAVSSNTQASTMESDDTEKIKDGYDLPVDEKESREAKAEIEKIYQRFEDKYASYERDFDGSFAVPLEDAEWIADELSTDGLLVKTNDFYSNLRNYEVADQSLLDFEKGNKGDFTLYVIKTNGSILREKYSFDGKDLYVLATNMSLNSDGDAVVDYCAYTRIASFRYTEEGWLCYELCVPEYPKVTETVDGSVLIRIKPISEEYKAASRTYVAGIGYQGNNLLRVDWDIDHLDRIDYTGLYEYLYLMDRGEAFFLAEDMEGIPAGDFEGLIMKYLPVSRQMIRDNSVFDADKMEYTWVQYGFINRDTSFFGTSIPEVTGIRENEDHTLTLTVNAVCEMVLNDNHAITHELTILPKEDGGFYYIGNKIVNDEMGGIPDYINRIPE